MPVSRDDIIDWLNQRIADGEIAKAAFALLKPTAPLPTTHLSPHFTMAEMTYSATAAQNGWANMPDAKAEAELKALCSKTLEGIRSTCGSNPVQVTSGYRSKQLNTAVGGASNSAHLYGCAADFVIPAFGSPKNICLTIESKMRDLEIDQLIFENDSWVHVGRAIPPNTTPRYQVLTIRGGQTLQGIV